MLVQTLPQVHVFLQIYFNWYLRTSVVFSLILTSFKNWSKIEIYTYHLTMKRQISFLKMFRLDHISVLCIFNCESDPNTKIVFSIPWVRAFKLKRGKTDFSFLSFEYSNTLIQGIFWSDYDTNQYNPSSSILL